METEKKESKQEHNIEKIRKAREEEQRVFNTLRNSKYQALISDCYSEMDSYVQMAIDGISTGVLIEGSAGTGKTYRSINMALRSRNGEEDVGYTDSYSTPASFFIWLYKNRDKKVLIVDDCAGFMNNDKILAFLKGALWEVNGKRIVNYMTTKPLKDEEEEYIPSTFEMGASIIIITNMVNKSNPHVQAVMSRINYCYVDIPREELLKILEQIIKKEYDGTTLEERKECLEFLKKNTSKSTENLNIRSLFKLYQFKVFSKNYNKPEFWKVLGTKMLKKDDKTVVVEELINDTSFQSEEERVAKFEELTGKGRASYFRLKKMLEK